MAPPRRRRNPTGVTSNRRLFGALLVAEGVLSARQLDEALAAQSASGERLGETVLRLGMASEGEVIRILGAQLGLPVADAPLDPTPDALRLVPGSIARRRLLLPLELGARTLTVAMGDPLDLAAVDELQFRAGRRVKVVLAPPSLLRRALRRAYSDAVDDAIRAIPGGAEEGEPTHENGTPDDEVGTPPGRHGRVPDGGSMGRLVDALVERAIEGGASDLHLEQGPRGLVVRERIDGVLRRVTGIPEGARHALLSRIKVISGMDIAVKRRPQDGGFTYRHGDRKLSLRVSTLPVEGGEKAVLRILDPTAVPGDLEGLGFADRDLRRLRELIRGGGGVILTAGPTGSGKSSTLFGALGELDREALNVVTLEDPIEYRVSGVNQVQVHPRAGLTFPAALRAVLRQDPDVVMVGEVRDRETAEIAMAAAVTGHLVLSTIHTTDAPGGITRLLQMGVPPHLVAGGLAGIVAQRLVRVICPECRGRQNSDCSHCHEGYRGRTGVFQLLAMSERLRERVMAGAGTGELRRQARDEGMGTMSDDARRKVAEGTTTPHEVARVLHRDPGEGEPCRHCGAPVPTDARGCPGCGVSLGVHCTCGRRLQDGWRHCPHCLRRRSLS
jgi:type IV pilus assembly protein PilB